MLLNNERNKKCFLTFRYCGRAGLSEIHGKATHDCREHHYVDWHYLLQLRTQHSLGVYNTRYFVR